MNGANPQIEPRKRRVMPGAERRQMILSAALTLFARDGYTGCEVEQIAREAGVGKGTIYRYYPSKQELFLALVDRGYELLQARMLKSRDMTLDVAERFKRGMQAHVDFFLENPDYYRVMMLELPDHRLKLSGDIMKRHQRYIQPLVNAIRASVDSGEFKQIDSEFTAFTIAAISCTVIERYLRGRGDTLQRDIEAAIEMFLHGVCK
ncbi:MAG: TetR/AcrR family transcriptional regulator [bacterium]